MTEQAQEQAAPENTEEPQTEPEQARTYSHEEYQAALNKVGAKEKREGRTTERQTILEELGFDDLEKLKGVVEAHRLMEEEVQSEAEKLQQQVSEKDAKIAEANEARDNALKLADSRLVDSELKGALIDAGVSAERVRKILNDPEIEKPGVEDGKVSGASLEAYVESAKKEWPELFGAKTERVPESPVPSNGSNPEADEKARQDFQRSAARKF